MKKILSALACATVILSATGCGNAADTADNVKKEAVAEVKETTEKAADLIAPTVLKVDSKFYIGGIFPSMKFDDVKNILGEPVSSHDDDEFIFANGIEIELNKSKSIVKEIKIKQGGVATGAGISVGMADYALNNAYGSADSIDNDDGKVEYKYYSADRKIKVEFETRNGVITEIKSKLND